MILNMYNLYNFLLFHLSYVIMKLLENFLIRVLIHSSLNLYKINNMDDEPLLFLLTHP